VRRTLILLGIALVALGLAWPWLARSGLGRLPGDFAFARGGIRFYFPLASCLVISACLSLAWWLFRR
jgi:hypothetical protein